MPFHDHDPLDVQFVGDGRHWTLTAPLHWDDPERAWTVAVPEGFTTDFASVPRALWPVMPPSGLGKTSVRWAYKARRTSDEQVVVEGENVTVSLHMDTFEIMETPEWLKQKLLTYQQRCRES